MSEAHDRTNRHLCTLDAFDALLGGPSGEAGGGAAAANAFGGTDAFDGLLGSPIPAPENSGLDVPVVVTKFPNAKAQTKTDHRTTLRALAAELSGVIAGSKDALPLFKLGTFGDMRTPKGCLRNNANLVSVSGVEADYDAGEISLDEAERRLRQTNLAALLYPTPSHTEEKPRWRVFCPCSAQKTPAERTALMERLNGVMDGALDGASFIVSQAFYGGSIEGASAFAVRMIEGRCIDLAVDLDASALPKGAGRREGVVERKVDESGSAALFRLAWDIKQEGGDLEAFRRAIEDTPMALAHVEKEADRGKGRAERAINRAWERTAAVRDWSEEFDEEPLHEARAAGQLRFLTPADCENAPPRRHIVKGLIAAGDVGCVFGSPGAGKSLFCPHIGYAVSQGRPVFDLKTKAGLVFYVAPEDTIGLAMRVRALRRQHGDAPAFLLIDGVSDLLSDDSAQAAELVDAVQTQAPALVFIDTLAMGFPGLEENSAEQMGRVVAMARTLASNGAAVILVHHDTKTASGTPRGHSLLNGALDFAIQLAKDENKIVRGKLTKNRNGGCDREFAFKIGSEILGADEDGDPVTAGTLTEIDPSNLPRTAKLSPSAQAALEILRRLTADEAGWVQNAEWRQACIRASTVSGSENADHRRRTFNEVRKKLLRAKVIFERDDLVRLAEWTGSLGAVPDAFDTESESWDPTGFSQDAPIPS